MLAELTRDLPEGEGWLYEPKWDGFRALVFWDGAELLIQSRDLKPLGRYFPELEAGLRQALTRACVLDGEVVIVDRSTGGGLDFDALQQRVHPAESRIRLLSRETPAEFVAFDLLAVGPSEVASRPLAERRAQLEDLLAEAPPPV